MKVERFTSPPFLEHTYLIWDESSKEALVVDPGGQEAAVDQVVATHQLRLKMILNTHGHIDHIARVTYFQKKYGIPFYLHRGDEEVVSRVNEHAGFFGMGEIEVPTVNEYLQEGQTFSIGETTFKVFETPGHTPGGCSFYCESEKSVVVGDLLFYLSVGRTDLPGGNFEQLAASIRLKIYRLPEDTQVLSGHGDPTSVGYEKTHNPFVTAEK